MTAHSVLTRNFQWLIKELLRGAIQKKDDFSGIGIVVYDCRLLDKIQHSSLRPSTKCPQGFRMDEDSTVKFLLGISSSVHSLHDGFHFFNEKGFLTHLSQYFVPPVIPEIESNESYGTRYHSAFYGSYVRGVVLTGVVLHCTEAFIFNKGKACRIQDELSACHQPK